MSKLHNFAERLEFSHNQSDQPFWFEVYKKAFPGLLAAVNVRNDGWAQRGGIDRVLTLDSGRTVRIDEKVRERDYPDFCLEYFSDYGRKTPGWVCKDLACEYIAYAFLPSKICYLLPHLDLRRAWQRNRMEWVAKYPKIEAQNNGYVTVSVGVPINVVLASICDAMKISWGPA